MMREYGNGIKICAPEELLPFDRALSQLSEIARDSRVEKPVLGLIDIHDKEDNDFPTGMVAASRSYIFPQLMVSGPNCGMRMMSLPFLMDEINPGDIDRLFHSLSRNIHVSSFLGTRLSEQDIMDIMSTGAGWVKRKFSMPDGELEHIEFNGNAFTQDEVDEDMIREAVPGSIREISKRRMGILGKGNHFLELQVVEEVFDGKSARLLSIRKNGLCLLMHSGSGGLGAMTSNLYCPKRMSSREKKMHAFVIAEWVKSMFNTKRRRYILRMIDYLKRNDGNLFGLEEDSEPAGLYLTAIRASSNFAYANRAFLAMKIREAVSESLKVDPNGVKTIYDLSHMSINREEHNGRHLWVHRSGGVRAFPPQALPEDSVFKATGTPVFLPGSMGDATYVCVSTENNSQTFYSAGHGAGRLSRDKIKGQSENRSELIDYLKERSVTLYKGESKKIIKQDPRCFKDVNKAAEYLETEQLTRKVAKLRPVAVLKG